MTMAYSIGTYDTQGYVRDTRGECCVRSCNFVPTNNSELTIGILENIKSINDQTVREQTMSFCDDICDYLRHNRISRLPKMFFELDEEDAYFEWIFDNFRIGFLFCVDPRNSAWLMVAKYDEDGNVRRYDGKYKGKATIDTVFSYIRRCA